MSNEKSLQAPLHSYERALITGDLSRLSEQERLSLYKNICESLGLNALTKPFEYINLNGKLTLYCTKSATEQLRSLHKVSLNITDRQKFDDVYVVTARAKTPDGREDEATGAVTVGNLKGDSLANAFMKAETKAKRRVTLSICGLGMLDETEIETIKGAVIVSPPAAYQITGGEYNGLTLEQLVQKVGYENARNWVMEMGIKHPENKAVKKLTDEWVKLDAIQPQPVIEATQVIVYPEAPTPPVFDDPMPDTHHGPPDEINELDQALGAPTPPKEQGVGKTTAKASGTTTTSSQTKKKAHTQEVNVPSASMNGSKPCTPQPSKGAAKRATPKQLESVMKRCTHHNISIQDLQAFLDTKNERLLDLTEEGLLSADKWIAEKINGPVYQPGS